MEEDGGFEFVGVTNPGFRTREVLVVTSRTNPNDISHASLANLYRRRWEAELYLRSLKTVMQMDHLRCKKPHRVRNELRMHLVAYNLIREVIAAAAVAAGVQPYPTNYKGALQTLNQFPPQLLTNTPTTTWLTTLLASIAAHTIGNRPDRVEPRVRKRRPKNYPLMTNPEPPTKPEPPYKLIESPSAIQS